MRVSLCAVMQMISPARTCCPLLVSFALSIGTASAQQHGTVSGKVLDAHTAPVAGAAVYAMPIGVALGTSLPRATTDAQGHYVLTLQYGHYAVTAAKPEAGYPPQYLSFYGDVPQPEIELGERNRNVVLDLKLGKKAGALAGTVANAETGVPIGDAGADLRRAGNLRASIRGGIKDILPNGHFRILIPSDVPVLLTIFQHGYQDWSPTQNGKAVPITLAPGESRALAVKLTPAADSKPTVYGSPSGATQPSRQSR